MRPVKKPPTAVREDGQVSPNGARALAAKKTSLSPIRQNLLTLTGQNQPLGATAGQRGISALISRKNQDLAIAQGRRFLNTPHTYTTLDPYTAHDQHKNHAQVSDFDLSAQYASTSPRLKRPPLNPY